MTLAKSAEFFGALGLGVVLAAGSVAQARDGQRTRGAQSARMTQPQARTAERLRTENGHTRTHTITRADGAQAARHAVVSNDREAGTRARNVDYTGFDGRTRSVDRVRTQTGDGFTRVTTLTDDQGETATRDLALTQDREAGTASRSASYTAFDGRAGSMSDVTQRTDDGFSRDTTRTSPDGETHTRGVEVSCDTDVGKCVRQVEVGRQP